MPTENVSVLINGKVQSNFERYSIESNLLIPADAWQITLGSQHGLLPADISEGSSVRVMVGNDVVLSGILDEIEEDISGRESQIGLSGRDGAAVLVDCSAPIFAAREVSLEGVIADIVKPLGISKIRIDADSTTTFEKVHAEPGETAWDVLQHVAEANGLWPWFEPDGTLVVGGADYSVPVSADLIMNYSGKGNNLKSLRRQRSITGRYSEVTVLGQAHGTEHADGQASILGKATDNGIKVYRPYVVIDSESTTRDIALRRARKLLSDGRLEGFSLVAQVRGHRISPGGSLWRPGMRIHVRSEPHKIDGIFFLMGRTFRLDTSGGTTTELLLKEDGVWTLDAHPHNKKHLRARDAEGKIIDITDSTQ